MPFFLDTREISQRFSKRIAEFCSLLDINHIRHGSPDDLFEFANVLENSNQFRNDLSALVKSAVKKEPDELLLTDMMSIIAASVGGPSFAETRADITKPTNTLMEFLLGTGCWRHFGSPSPGAPKIAAPPVRQPVHAPIHTEEPRHIPISAPVAPAPAAGQNPENRSSLLEASSELRQTLTRLEINTLQVKLHLESIEQRISKIEPSPEAPREHTSLSPEPRAHYSSAHELVEPVERPIQNIPAVETAPPTRGRAVFSAPFQPEPVDTDDFQSPTFAFGSEKGRNIIPIVVVVLLMILAAFFLVYSGPGQVVLKTVHEFFSGAPTATLSPASVPDSTQAPQAPPTPPATNQNPADTSSGQSSAAGSTPNGSPAVASEPDDSDLKYVQSSVMEGYLLSAPSPAYPAAARSSHIAGRVALQATISKSGSIRTLHAIKGPQLLRAAAIDAVRTWRYRPYSVDGRPVDVATTIYVNFSLGPPPAIAH